MWCERCGKISAAICFMGGEDVGILKRRIKTTTPKNLWVAVGVG